VLYCVGRDISRKKKLLAKDAFVINNWFLTYLRTHFFFAPLWRRIKCLFVNGWLKSTWNWKARRTWKLKTLRHEVSLTFATTYEHLFPLPYYCAFSDFPLYSATLQNQLLP
jgi:hypothetical protein